MILTCCPPRGCSRRSPRSIVRATPETASFCLICSSLDIVAVLRHGHSWENKIPLGSLVDILRKADQCRFCHLIASLFRCRWRLDVFNVDLSGVNCFLYSMDAGVLSNSRLENRKRCHRLHIHYSDRPQEITSALLRARMDLTTEIQLLEEDAHKFRRAKEVHGRRMTDTIDIGLVKRWISLCEQEHGDTCKSMWWRDNDVQPLPFLRMVDVDLMSVVRAPSHCRYVALSYVWGAIGDSYWTTEANVDSRSLPAGLRSSALPATIMDSIQVAQALGERYLWVDALCIVQDNSDDKNNQIRVMDLIFSRAVLTIVAADGQSVLAGLPGLSVGSRSHHQHIEIVQDLHLAIPLPSLNEAIAGSVWDTRGWTYQELLLSRRRLFFTKHQVYFECARDIWCEDLFAESKVVRYSDHPMRRRGSGDRLLLGPRPPAHPHLDYLSAYTRIVQRYTQRHLTYPSDVIHAITAITNAMSRGFRLTGETTTHAFRYGMQIWNLNYSLLWQPTLDSIHVRRVCLDKGAVTWPSWAWAGWIGAVCYSGSDQLMHIAIRTPNGAKPAESLVRNWYIIDDDHQPIRLDVEMIPFLRSWKPGEEDIVDARPRYQVPECDINPQNLGPIPPMGTLIFCTQRATFTVSKLEDTSQDVQPFPHTIFCVLSDARKPSVPVGRMIFPSTLASEIKLDFIVLSRRGGARGLYDESVYGDWYHGCLLHVMAVRRVGYDTQLQERVGLGVIVEKAWLECGAEVERIFLA